MISDEEDNDLNASHNTLNQSMLMEDSNEALQVIYSLELINTFKNTQYFILIR